MKLRDILAIAAKKTNTQTGYATAKALGRKPNTIYRWESGDRAPDADACLQLAEFTGLDIKTVIEAAREARAKKRAAAHAAILTTLSFVAVLMTTYTPESRASISSAVDKLCIMSNNAFPFDSVTWSSSGARPALVAGADCAPGQNLFATRRPIYP